MFLPFLGVYILPPLIHPSIHPSDNFLSPLLQDPRVLESISAVFGWRCDCTLDMLVLYRRASSIKRRTIQTNRRSRA